MKGTYKHGLHAKGRFLFPACWAASNGSITGGRIGEAMEGLGF